MMELYWDARAFEQAQDSQEKKDIKLYKLHVVV